MMYRLSLLPLLLLTSATRAADTPEIPVPTSPDWSPSLLLVLTWLLAAILILGPLAKLFRLEPKNPQHFTDDPPLPR